MSASSDVRRKTELMLVAALAAALPARKFFASRGGDDFADGAELPVTPFAVVEITEAERRGVGADLTWQLGGGVAYVTSIYDTSTPEHAIAVKEIYGALAAITGGYDGEQGVMLNGLEITDTSDFQDEEKRAHGDLISFVAGVTEK